MTDGTPIELTFSPFTLASAPPIAGRAAGATGANPAPTTTSEGVPLPAGAPPGAGGRPAAGPDFSIIIMMGAVFVLIILMSTMSARKEKKKRAELLNSLGRHDRVQTIGGMIGTVVELRDDEVVLKVDESTNTRIAFARSSVQTILKKGRDSRAPELEPAEVARA